MNMDRFKACFKGRPEAHRTGCSVPDAVVRLLFVSLVLAQVLDVHSTLGAPAHRSEVNPAILWIAAHIGTQAALLFIKSFSVLVIALLYRSWRQGGGQHNRLYTLVLLVLNIEYAVVLLNNYL